MNPPNSKIRYPLLILGLITLSAYGMLVPFTGFYWDDWPFAWIAKFLGPAEFIPAFLPFRPFLGPIFAATTSLVPPYPIYWQIFSLLIRFAMGVSVWWSLGWLWPQKTEINFIAAILVLVYPGYSQHWVALTHINQELIPFIFYILSLGFTFKALRSDNPLPSSILAFLLQILGLYPTEYMFPLEGLRFLLLFFFHANGTFGARFVSVLKIWWGYLVIWLSNAAWLYYYYTYGPYHSYEINTTQSSGFSRLLFELLDAVWKACVYVWVQILALMSDAVTAPVSLLTLSLIVVSLIALTRLLPALDHAIPETTFSSALIVTGVISILLGRLPSLAAGLPLRLQTIHDRYMISMMMGSIFFLIGAIELGIRVPRKKSVLYILLIAMGIGQQFYSGNTFRRDWEKQKEFFWQLTSRIPAIPPNTTLLTHQLPTDNEPDLSYTGPVNWIYASQITPPILPYALIYTEKRVGGSVLPSLEPDSPIQFNYRTVRFSGSTSQVITIYMPVNGCLRVLDPRRNDSEIYSDQPDAMRDVIDLSNPDLIQPNPASPAQPWFLQEDPPENWCTYFTKAELAHQLGKYSETVRLMDTAVERGYQPEDPKEWLLYIDARARMGDLESAQEKSSVLLNQDRRMKSGVCAVWENLEALELTPPGLSEELFSCN